MKTGSSNCVYCGLPAYGKGCRFAPNSVHVHATPSRCMFCGLNAVGKGCRFSPNGIHVKFGQFGFIQSEDTVKSSALGYLLEKLISPVEDHLSYKLGLIDQDGNVIKSPVTDLETSSMSLSEQSLINLKIKLKESILAVIGETLYCNTVNINEKFDVNQYEKELKFKESIENTIEIMYNIIEEYRSILSPNMIDQYIIETFIKHESNKSRPGKDFEYTS